MNARLLVVRHAIALAAAEGQDDAARPLSADGKRRFAEVVRGLRRLGVRPDRLLHSPKLRAVQTAELLAPLVRGRTEVTALLAQSAGEPLLASLRSGDAVVGHEPFLGELVAWLVTGERQLASHFSPKKGGVVVLTGEIRPGGMAIAAFYAPKVLRGG